ncbi:hypothetical protein [Shinella sp.]|uniref:hypothetical protein n=1 Tax=Shinella sp. TaxID=1870904 RepID=UPI0028AADF35|nr:hypothetical protein [Shinella sp.]
MTMWQFMAAVDGYIKANSTDEPGKLDGGEVDEIWEWLQSGKKAPISQELDKKLLSVSFSLEVAGAVWIGGARR